MPARVAVVMPTYDQDAWLPAAVTSLLRQTWTDWECVVVDDGSPGDVVGVLGALLEDPRVRVERLPRNGGLGAALNRGLDLTDAPLVGYLPSDDVWHADHLASLVAALDAQPGAVMAVAGVRHGQGLTATDAAGRIPGEPLQLVQVLHRRTADRWVERAELTTDDLDRMLWTRLAEQGDVVETGRVTCEWGWHPRQRHLAMREPWGGVNTYRDRYQVQEPLRFQSTVGSLHDEVAQYREDRARATTRRAPDGLRILLVGELAHNPERVLALEERGHELHGLWMPDPLWFNAVGPAPFGHVRDVPRDRWREAVRELQPDVVYGLLNWQAVPFVHEVLDADLGLPFVWHVKEGPFFSRQHGHWPQLVDLHLRTDAQVYSSAELRDWFALTVPGSADGLSLVLDGDLPRPRPDAEQRSPLLSSTDGELHTVIPGRPLGPSPEVVGALAERGVHVHLYGHKNATQMADWVAQCRRVAPRHFHVHAQVAPDGWVEEFSQYDAGWLHDVRSTNGGDLAAATWDDLNVPARLATLAACGVPAIQRDNTGSRVAMQTLARDGGFGVFYRDADDLAAQLRDRAAMDARREAMWAARRQFTFDAHVDDLVALFHAAIARHRARRRVPTFSGGYVDLGGVRTG